MSASTGERLEAALSYLRRGWALLPIRPGSKAPHATALRTVHGSAQWGPLAQRPASPAEVRAWFEHDPETGVALITGQPSGGLVVADFDRTPRDVRHPPAPVVRTGRGFHVYLRSSGPTPCRKTPWGDLKGDGGYVLAPLTEHPNGGRYAWTVGPNDADLPSLHELRDGGRPLIDSTTLSPDSEGSTTGTPYELPVAASTAPGTGNELAKVESAVVRALPVLGIGATLGRAFGCVLPGHPDRRPSASLWRDPLTAVFKYRDWHCADGDEWWSLAEVFASRCAGRPVRLSGPSASRWYTRLWFEAGLITLTPPPMPRMPASASPAARRVTNGFALLLAVRALRDPAGEPAPFTRKFAAAWCGLTVAQAREGIAELVRQDVLRVEDWHGRMKLYGVGAGAAGPRRRTRGRDRQARAAT